jgi:hypothetical protein
MPKDYFEEDTIVDWSVIENYEKEDTIASWSMALAELHKLLDYLLEEQGYIGDSLETKIKKAKVRFTDIKGLKEALEIYDKVFKKYSETTNILEIKDAVKNFEKAVNDLISPSDFSPPSLIERMKASFDYYFSDKGKFYKFALSFLSLVVFTLVLDSTHFGQKIISFLASLFSSILSWLILLGLIIGGIAILVIGTIIFFARGK